MVRDYGRPSTVRGISLMRSVRDLREVERAQAMIPEASEYLSFLMGADAIADHELTSLGVKIPKGAGSTFRSVLVPEGGPSGYKALIRETVAPGHWNDIFGRQEILFSFKLADSTLRELKLSEATRSVVWRRTLVWRREAGSAGVRSCASTRWARGGGGAH